MARTEGGYRTPRPDPVVERRSTGNGPVITYNLSPEELERYRAMTPDSTKPVKKPIDLKRYQGRPKEEEEMADRRNLDELLPRATYLELRLQGKGRFQIKNEFNISNQAFYNLLDRYGLKEKDAEDAALELLGAEKSPEPVAEAEMERESTVPPMTSEPDTRDAKIAALKAEVDGLKMANESLHNSLRSTEIERDSLLVTIEKAVESEDNGMTLGRYQMLAARTANADWDLISIRLIRNPKLLPLLNFALGAAGEAGEIADEVKKIIFHGHKMDVDRLAKEIGDCLWYLSQLSMIVGFRFDSIAERNIEKLKERYPEGFSEVQSQNRGVNHESA